METKRPAHPTTTERLQHAAFTPTLLTSNQAFSRSVYLPENHYLQSTQLVAQSEEVIGLVAVRALKNRYLHSPYLISWKLHSPVPKTIHVFDEGPTLPKPTVLACALSRRHIAIAYVNEILIYDLNKGVISTHKITLGTGSIDDIGVLNTGEIIIRVGYVNKEAIEIWDMKSIQSTHLCSYYLEYNIFRLFNNFNPGLKVLSNGKIIASIKDASGNGSFGIFEWEGKKLNLVKPIMGRFLCETSTGIFTYNNLACQDSFSNLLSRRNPGVEFQIYDKKTLELTHSRNYKSASSPSLVRAFCRPDGNIALMCGYNYTNKLHRTEECDTAQLIILSPALELVAEWPCDKSLLNAFVDVGMADAASFAEPIFTKRGWTLGKPQEYCKPPSYSISGAYDVVADSLQPLSLDLVNMVMEYTGDDIGEPKTLSRKSLHQFVTMLIASLADEKQFPNYEGEYSRLFGMAKKYSAQKQVLIKALRELLSTSEKDTFLIEENIALLINNFCQLLQSGKDPDYLQQWSDLLCENMFRPPVDRSEWVKSHLPEFKSEFSVSKLRSLVSFLTTARIIPGPAEQKEVKAQASAVEINPRDALAECLQFFHTSCAFSLLAPRDSEQDKLYEYAWSLMPLRGSLQISAEQFNQVKEKLLPILNQLKALANQKQYAAMEEALHLPRFAINRTRPITMHQLDYAIEKQAEQMKLLLSKEVAVCKLV